MESIKILATGKYLPNNKITNNKLEEQFNLSPGWILDRTGIQNRFYTGEDITVLAINAVKDLINKSKFDINKVDLIITATTSTKKIMPSISFKIQKEFDIKNCKCFDILAGCSGYINAFDIARKYIATNDSKYALVIGVDKLSECINKTDINIVSLLGDGASASILGSTKDKKIYYSNIESIGQIGDILTYEIPNNIYMDGKQVYRFGITKPVENIKKLLDKSNIAIEDIKYIIPHQSNLKMLKRICKELHIEESKMYINIENVGNTFCASIPMALAKMFEQKLLKQGDKIILVGYGGGVNLGSILLEI